MLEVLAMLGERDPWFGSFDDYVDLYLLCDVDFPWKDDGTRYFPRPEDRGRFFTACKNELIAREVNHVVVSGSPERRLKQSVDAVSSLLNRSNPNSKLIGAKRTLKRTPKR